MKDQYVKNHDFGYGKDKDIHKLTLRNYHDFEEYLHFCLDNLYNAKVKGKTLYFKEHTLQVMTRHRMQ